MAELKDRFGDTLQVNAHRGERGIFDVKADGKLVFSKHATGRFPARGEVSAAIAKLLP